MGGMQFYLIVQLTQQLLPRGTTQPECLPNKFYTDNIRDGSPIVKSYKLISQ
jgi:hypothetical protein